MASPAPRKSQIGASPQWEKPDRVLKEWATRTPRLLFRGFHALSGGGPKTLVQNDTKGIVPHLFGGAKLQKLIKRWSPTTGLRELSPDETRKLIKAHLGMRLEPTAFSSWTSDYQTALLSVIEATNGDYTLFDDYPDLSKRHIALVDTAILGSDTSHTITEVLHVSALHEAKLADVDQPCGFLVYGPVEGKAMRTVPLSDIACLGFDPRESWFISNRTTNWTNQLITDKTLRAREIAEKFRDENNRTPDIFLAVLAAELSRQRAPKVDMQVSDMLKYRWKDEEVELIVGLSKKDIASLRLGHGGKTALVNQSIKQPWEDVPEDDNENGRHCKRRRPVIRDTMGHLLIKDMAGPKIGDIEEPPRKASYFIEAGAIAEIIADALKRIARLNLQE